MMIQYGYCFEYAFAFAVIAFVYSNLLTEPNAIFFGLYNRLNTFFKTEKRADEGKQVHWLFMILIYCAKCIAGELAFWFYIYDNWRYYNLLEHLFLTCLSILFAGLIRNIYTNTNKDGN